ncbi:unnamed protein product [Periconia digitata]|uniref:tRNA-splicing endonuclease subunit Sen15 domain-containing protein n=1 Tax=Periconia digitata TaxID=1303443 RepID=A0A9W4U6Y8_9PLEO|nr:unnamed protein product [Periconia digitata]
MNMKPTATVASLLPFPSPLQSLIRDSPTDHDSSTTSALHSLAIQIVHNLQHQHFWTHLHIHTHSPVTNAPLPRPLISGLPPQRLYIHPDEQIELVKSADRARKAAAKAKAEKDATGEDSAAAASLDVKAAPEREWVLPTRLSEKWTLRRLAEIFDAVSLVPPAPATESEEGNALNGDVSDQNLVRENPWRTTKRVVLATADTDSTVVYYIMQDGLVKPRQN